MTRGTAPYIDRRGDRRRGGLSVRARAVAAALGACVVAGASPGVAPADPPVDAPLRFEDVTASALEAPGAMPCWTLRSACAFVDVDGDAWDDLVNVGGGAAGWTLHLNRPAAEDAGGGAPGDAAAGEAAPGDEAPADAAPADTVPGAPSRRFVPAPAGHGLDLAPCAGRDGACVTAGDVDGDGDEDLFIGCNWVSTQPAGAGGNILLLNDGTGRFTDAAAAAGLADGDHTTAGAVLFDMDLDGDLDLFSCNSTFDFADAQGDGLAHLWRNTLAETGTLAFVDETTARGIVEIGRAVWAIAAVDFDADGDADLVVSHDAGGLTQVFRNDGAGNFQDRTLYSGSGAGDDGDPSTFGDDTQNAMGLAWGDIENDGDLDLFVTNIGPHPLYRNNGDATFTDIGLRAGVRAGGVTWGCGFEDFNLDGFVDLYAVGGDVEVEARAMVRSWLWRNLRNGAFSEEFEGSGLVRATPRRREIGSATADFDGDGRVDLFVSCAEPAGVPPYLYRNVTETGARRSLGVALRGNGTTSNRSAIGATLRVTFRDADGAALAGLAQVRVVEGADGRGSRSSLAETFGAGDAAATADVTVVWPRAGTLAARTQTYVDVPLDHRVVLHEDPRADAWRLASERRVAVVAGRTSTVAIDGDRAPDPLVLVEVVTGPRWARIGPRADTIRPLVVRPAAVRRAREFVVALRAVTQGAADAESSQVMTIEVRPAPRARAARRVGDDIVVVGANLGHAALELRVDGEVAEVVRRGRTSLRARIPDAVLATWDGAAHTATVEDPETGAASSRAVRRSR